MSPLGFLDRFDNWRARCARLFGSWTAWSLIRVSGVWAYSENAVTGQRRAVRVRGGLQPLDMSFLRDGDVVVNLQDRWTVKGHVLVMPGRPTVRAARLPLKDARR
ncbi:hypothetical protein IZ6_07430 [Terrihabitans soli]|uniref:Uncharacterized protein n=1 Tax=Terrihabitans soli TaxID=708113 RepID=A0A6S6QU58_9HYPH|nr:hypothetical protein [Terrihabitans soli]BCJ90008.1 hypothetical protein IZ6_07430 [Terrihabitans soli]